MKHHSVSAVEHWTASEARKKREIAIRKDERMKVLDKIGFRCKKLMHMTSKEEVENGDLIICAASLHELLVEFRQSKDGEP
jgi:hypothetical protein